MDKFIDKIKVIVNRKSFHFCVIILIILVLVGITGFIIMKYKDEGETNMPFNISKINIISSSSGENSANPNPDARWNIDVSQNNDIYVYIEKNEGYEGTEVIDTVTFDNFNFETTPKIGELKIYKPDSNSDKALFKNIDEDIVDELTYTGSTSSNLKDLEISNQGDMIYFRICNKNIAKYVSNDDEINYNDLLKKTNVQETDLETDMNFDVTINLKSHKSFSTKVSLQIPADGVVEKGTTSNEIKDTQNYVFKRIKNDNI